MFNASIANATILQKNTAGYSAVFSGRESFREGLKDCVAALKAGSDQERVFIFADEKIPETYAPVAGVPYPNAVCALALRLTTDAGRGEKVLDETPLEGEFATAAEEAIAFIKQRLA